MAGQKHTADQVKELGNRLAEVQNDVKTHKRLATLGIGAVSIISLLIAFAQPIADVVTQLGFIQAPATR